MVSAMSPEERFERIEQSMQRAQERWELSERISQERFARIEHNLEMCIQIGMRTDARLDHAIRLAVREARAERRKRREMDARLDRLAANVQALVDSTKPRGNGQP
ncbi:MAG: hypothetical protein C5B51_10000 [Terriglobia bacterium]|nr:MAG: hypothetical protein C5B51_10000 [Terriglobia bacterium]